MQHRFEFIATYVDCTLKKNVWAGNFLDQHVFDTKGCYTVTVYKLNDYVDVGNKKYFL